MFLRSARLCGAVPPFFRSTPWLASKYGAEKLTTRERAAVIVASSNAKSNGFAPGRNNVSHGMTFQEIFEDGIPSFAAIAFPRSISYPVGLMTVSPRSVPTWKPTAGGSSPTTSWPECRVGGDAAGFAAAAGTATRAASRTAKRRRFKVSLPVSCRRAERNLEMRALPGFRGSASRSGSAAKPPISYACRRWLRAVRASGQGRGRQLLEVADELLAPAHEHAVLERAARDSPVHALDEVAI